MTTFELFTGSSLFDIVGIDHGFSFPLRYFEVHHHGMTEQLSRTVFVATDHPVRRQPRDVLGVTYKIVSLKPGKFFGIGKDWIDEIPFSVTDREKTII